MSSEHLQQGYTRLTSENKQCLIDYLDLEALMSVLNNGRFLSRAIDLCDDSRASRDHGRWRGR